MQKFQLEQGLSEFSTTYRGFGNFIVWLIDGETGQNIDLITNQVGLSNSSKAVGITPAGDYILNVQSNGSWTATITRPCCFCFHYFSCGRIRSTFRDKRIDSKEAEMQRL